MSTLQEIDRTKVCRTCLTYSEDMKSLYEAYLISNQLSLAEILMAITPLKCYANDGLPTHICQSCTSSLTLFHIFQVKCLETDQLLRDELHQSNQPIEPTQFTSVLIKTEPPDENPNVEPQISTKIKTENGVSLQENSNLNTPDDSISNKLTSKLFMALNSNSYSKPDINIPEIQKDLSKKLDMTHEIVKVNIDAIISQKTVLETEKTTSVKPYACKVCDEKFDAQTKLKQHMTGHKGDKPFSCTLCTSSFISQASLTIHMRKHTGEKPYACQVCQRLFTQLGALNIHMRTHSDTKPYVCKICEVGFNHKTSLLSHMRKHVGEQIRAQFASRFKR